MDLFDLSHYFGSVVPVQARSHPLLKHAACAYAAKQLGRTKGTNTAVDSNASKDASMEVYEDPLTDLEWEGAYHYDKSIALLMDTMKQNHNSSGAPSQESVTSFNQTSELSSRMNVPLDFGSSDCTLQLRSDEVVAAAAILCVYEFLSATGTAWSRHLNGTKSLLDIAEANIFPLQMPPFDPFLVPQRRIYSKARKATFWNFARQDYIAACEPVQTACSIL